MNKEQLDQIDRIVSELFKPDYLARVRGKLIYRADEREVDPEAISEVTQRLLLLGFASQITQKNGDILLRVYPYSSELAPLRWRINLLLFVATIFTTMAAGAILQGKDIFSDFSLITAGWQYSLAVMIILTSHEMGHFLAGRYHKVNVTLPYYIPIFFPQFNFGTMGAFIKIKSPIPNRRALLDIGIAGPLAGLFFSLFFLTWGYARLPNYEGIIAYVERIHPWNAGNSGVNLVLGKSLIFSFFNDLIAGGRLPMNEVYHFPFIFAGWIGLLVTAINLMPIGQLDGGHILYSLLKGRARQMGVLAFVGLLTLNFYLIYQYLSFIWVLWILLVFFLIGFRHPPTLDDEEGLTPRRRLLGWLSMIIFLLSFIPLPISIQ